MASRYLRATGNWNGPVWAATSSGAAGSAATPTADDNVYILANYSVVLDTAVSIAFLQINSGSLATDGYNLTLNQGLILDGNGTKEIDISGSTITVNSTYGTGVRISATGTTFESYNSTIVINNITENESGFTSFDTGGMTFDNVVINLGYSTASEVAIHGSPTFRSLIIQSKNSAAHTVNFDGTGNRIEVDKFVAIGSSSSNRLTLGVSGSSYTAIGFRQNATSYGQYVSLPNPADDGLSMVINDWYDGSSWNGEWDNAYIGSNSIQSDWNAWKLQDPPKISTLVDPLTTAPGSNPNWTVSGTVTQVTTGHEGGGYQLASGATITSTDTFDIVDNYIIVEARGLLYENVYLYLQIDGITFKSLNNSIGTANLYLRYKANSATNTIDVDYSTDGLSWTSYSSDTFYNEINQYRSVRLGFKSYAGPATVGSINPSLNQAPTTTLNSPANNVSLTTTTPTLAFTATDPEGEDVSYQIQVSTSSSFTTTHMDVTTTSYASGTQQTRVVSPALTQGGIDYYWRVRAKDPSGSDSYGAWATARKMTTEAIAPSVTSGATSSIAITTATVAGEVTSVNGASLTERGFVYSTSTNPTTADTKKIVAGQAGSFSTSLTGLTSNTTYYWRAYAINSKGTTYGVNRSFKTLPILPTATTGTAGTPGLTTVTITGNAITNPDSLSLTEYGVVYGTATNPTIANSKKTSTDSIANYPAALTGLAEGTTYYARAYVTFDGNTYYGSQISFKTTGRPIITINSPANNGTTGDLAPRLEFTGTDSDNERIEYQLQANPTNSFTSPAIDTTTGFTNLDTPADTSPFLPANKIRYTYPTNLARGSDLYWRVRGRDPSGSNQWGEWTTASKLTIDTVAPTIGITGFSDINDTNLKITADITNDGGATVTARGVCWSLTANPTTADAKTTGSGNPFTVTATGLTASTVYNFRAYATNAKGTSYSNNITQQSEQPDTVPTVTTADATGIYYTNANVGGEVTLDGRHTVTERGVVFSETSNPTIADRKFTAPAGGLGSFNGGITGLDPDTTYHIRAYAINSQGAGYGADKTFKTLALPADEDDGYWVFSNTGSTAVVARTQATPKNSSADLYIEPFLTVGKTYTIHVGNISADAGTPKLVLEYIDGTLQSFTIAQNTSKTFTYSGTTSLVRLRLYVTDGTAVAGELTATFEDMYMAEEGTFSEFVPFQRQGAKEIKIINNQIIDKRREDVLPTIYSKLLGLRYTPFDITTEGLGYFEVYDGFKIKDPNDDEITVLMTDKKLTLDGGIQEKLQGKTPDKTETDYSKAGGITKLLSQTTLQVDKQAGNIEALVSDIYDNNGYIENKFSQVYQDVNQVKTTVQGAGGVNLVRNSAMFAYNNLGYPDIWTTTVGGTGTITIQGDPESRNAGAIAGNSFTLKDATVKQTVTVRKDADFIAADQKTYYAFNAKVKKNLVGDAYIKLSNRNETHQIDLESGTEYYWDDITFESLLPLDDNYEIEIYSDSDAQLQVTDVVLSVGELRHEWTPAAGELGNASVSITEDGMTIRQAQFKYNYLKLDALGIEVNQKVIGQDWQIFGFNGAETNTYQLKTEKQFTMGSMRILPIDDGAGLTGWAFTPKEGA